MSPCGWKRDVGQWVILIATNWPINSPVPRVTSTSCWIFGLSASTKPIPASLEITSDDGFVGTLDDLDDGALAATTAIETGNAGEHAVNRRTPGASAAG